MGRVNYAPQKGSVDRASRFHHKCILGSRARPLTASSRGPNGEQRDDWREKHMIDWAKQCEVGFVDKDLEDKERVAIVMRITNEKADGWYATQHPYRVVARAGRP